MLSLVVSLLLLGGACARMTMDSTAPALSFDGGPPPSFVTQPQDHFDAANTKTWQQARPEAIRSALGYRNTPNCVHAAGILRERHVFCSRQ